MRHLPAALLRTCGDLVSEGRGARLSGTGGWLLAFGLLSACASSGTYDLRPAYDAVAPLSQAAYLDCNGVSDIVCDCRRGGIEQEFATPSPKHFDQGYTVLAAEIENGTEQSAAEAKAVVAVLAAITDDVEEICSYHEEAAD